MAWKKSNEVAALDLEAAGEGHHAPRPWGDKVFPQVPPDDVSQALAKRMMPPTGHIWRNRKGGGWRGHLEAATGKEFKRISCRFRDVGGSSRKACLNVTRRLWQQYLYWKALDNDECPVPGLMATEKEEKEELEDPEEEEDDDQDNEDQEE